MNETDDDKFGFKLRFQSASIDQLIDAFNGEVGNPGWVSARAYFLEALRQELLSRDFDSSLIAGEGGLKLAKRVRRVSDHLELAGD